MPRKSKLWRYTAGDYGRSVEVFEKRPAGPLYARAWDPVRKQRIKVALGHADREEAKKYADAESAKLVAGAANITPSKTVGYLLMQYLTHRTPQKAKAQHAEDRRRAELWRTVLGVQRRISTLGSDDWHGFIRARMSGAIDSHGRHVPIKDRVAVGPRTVDGDLVFIVAVFNWATAWHVRGTPMIEKNPWGGGAPGVKRALERPKNLEPKQPVATYERFLAVREAAEQVMMEARKGDPAAARVVIGRAKFRNGEGPVVKWMRPSYLPEILDLVEDTGRRITAICRLMYSDLIVKNGEPVAIRWRPMKGAKAKVVPLARTGRAREAIKRILADRPGVGDAPLFPSVRSPNVAIGKRTATDWLIDAEAKAFEAGTIEVKHLDGGSFHPYRRKWATERKHHPDADVMAAGGWTDGRSLKNSYQKEDDATTLAVINEPRKLVGLKA